MISRSEMLNILNRSRRSRRRLLMAYWTCLMALFAFFCCNTAREQPYKDHLAVVVLCGSSLAATCTARNPHFRDEAHRVAECAAPGANQAGHGKRCSANGRARAPSVRRDVQQGLRLPVVACICVGDVFDSSREYSLRGSGIPSHTAIVAALYDCFKLAAVVDRVERAGYGG